MRIGAGRVTDTTTHTDTKTEKGDDKEREELSAKKESDEKGRVGRGGQTSHTMDDHLGVQTRGDVRGKIIIGRTVRQILLSLR